MFKQKGNLPFFLVSMIDSKGIRIIIQINFKEEVKQEEASDEEESAEEDEDGEEQVKETDETSE